MHGHVIETACGSRERTSQSTPRLRPPASNLLEGSCLIARGSPMGTTPFAHKKVKLRTSHSDNRNADRPTPVHYGQRSPKSLHQKKTGASRPPEGTIQNQEDTNDTDGSAHQQELDVCFTAPTLQTMSVVRNRDACERQSARTIQARLHTELSHANCRTRC